MKIVKDYCFDKHEKLKSVIFPENSELENIDHCVFSECSIKKLVLPKSLKSFEEDCFQYIKNLTEIKISPENKYYSLLDNTYLLGKSDKESDVFDVLCFATRDIEKAVIPSYIKVINNYAFQNCSQLRSLIFKPKSLLEKICIFTFSDIPGQEKIVIPPLVTYLGDFSFCGVENLKTIEFLGKSLILNFSCLSVCKLLSVVSFPNAEYITFKYRTISEIPKNAKIFVRRNAILTGTD